AATDRPLGQPMVHPGIVWSVAFSPDGQTLLTGSRDKMARLWDADTGQPIGPPLPHSSNVWTVAFSPAGRSLLTGDSVAARGWEAPARRAEVVPRLAAGTEPAAGGELEARGWLRVLDQAARLERGRRLEQLGGPPPADPATRLDPILFGHEPAARGDAW